MIHSPRDSIGSTSLSASPSPMRTCTAAGISPRFFSGEYVAATELVIGALFVKHGVRTGELLVGLLLGNLLAVLWWVLICAPIAVQSRLTLYWYLRWIVGPGAYGRRQRAQRRAVLLSGGGDDRCVRLRRWIGL